MASFACFAMVIGMSLATPIIIAVQDKALRQALAVACARLEQGISTPGSAEELHAIFPAPGGRIPYIVICDSGMGAQMTLDDPAALVCVLGSAENIRTGSSLRVVYPLPLRLGIMLDRMRAHLAHRRAALWRPAEIFEVGKWYFIPDELSLRPRQEMAAADQGIRLTEKERDIMALLCGAAGEIITRQDMLDDVWGYAAGLDTHTLETHIYRLRQKLEDDPAKPMLLVTEEGGYRLHLSK